MMKPITLYAGFLKLITSKTDDDVWKEHEECIWEMGMVILAYTGKKKKNFVLLGRMPICG